MTNLPLVSIIIVNLNGQRWLADCLSSIKDQSYKSLEVILVDNGSGDNSLEIAQNIFKNIKIIRLDKNYGFAKANNIGLDHARGEIIFFLNNDTRIEKDLVKKIIEKFETNPKIGSIQPKILLMNKNNNIDLVGTYFTPFTWLYYIGLNQEKSLFNESMKVFSNKGAAMFVRKKILEKIGCFDEDFWSYYEETDLCHRIWIYGYECWYMPLSICYHANGGTSSVLNNNLIQFHNFKNKTLSLLKNFETIHLVWLLPIHCSFIGGIILLMFVKGKVGVALSIIKGFWWNFYHIRETLVKRRYVAGIRRVHDLDYLKYTMKWLPVGQIIKQML